MRGGFRRLAVLLLLTLCAGCVDWSADGADRRDRAGERPIVGMIQMFSGRIPPSWYLSDEVRFDLERTMTQLLPAAGAHVRTAEPLGFRSVDVSNLVTTQGRASATKLEKGRIVVELADGTVIVLDDPDSTGLRTVLPEISLQVDPTIGDLIEDALRE